MVIPGYELCGNWMGTCHLGTCCKGLRATLPYGAVNPEGKLNPSTNVIATPNAIPVFESINQECESTTRMNDGLKEGVPTVGYQVPSNTHFNPSRTFLKAHVAGLSEMDKS